MTELILSGLVVLWVSLAIYCLHGWQRTLADWRDSIDKLSDERKKWEA